MNKYYNVSDSDSSDSDVDDSDDSDVDTKNKKTKDIEVEIEDDDTDETEKDPDPAGANDAKEALRLLTEQDSEQEAIDKYMMDRRKEMQIAMAQPQPSKEVKFLIDAVPGKDDHAQTKPTNKPNEDEEGEVLICEEILPDGTINVLPTTSQPVPQPIPQPVQSVTSIPSVPVIESKQEVSDEKMPVVFRTATLEPPEVSALTRISPSQRDDLYTKLYQDAKANVLHQVDTTKTTTDKINELIRKECDRLLLLYKNKK
jgi:hypothetical protein